MRCWPTRVSTGHKVPPARPNTAISPARIAESSNPAHRRFASLNASRICYIARPIFSSRGPPARNESVHKRRYPPAVKAPSTTARRGCPPSWQGPKIEPSRPPIVAAGNERTSPNKMIIIVAPEALKRWARLACWDGIGRAEAGGLLLDNPRHFPVNPRPPPRPARAPRGRPTTSFAEGASRFRNAFQQVARAIGGPPRSNEPLWRSDFQSGCPLPAAKGITGPSEREGASCPAARCHVSACVALFIPVGDRGFMSAFSRSGRRFDLDAGHAPPINATALPPDLTRPVPPPAP